jgi:hypothetical protein
MQVVGSDKFKFFPVKIGNIILPFASIRSIYEEAYGDEKRLYIKTVYDDTYHVEGDITLDQANEIYTKAFKDCEY